MFTLTTGRTQVRGRAFPCLRIPARGAAVGGVPALGDLAVDDPVELQLADRDAPAETRVRRIVDEQDADAVAVGEGVVGHDRLDARVDVGQQPPHPGDEGAHGGLAAPVAARLVEDEVVGEQLVEGGEVTGVQRVDVPPDQYDAVVERHGRWYRVRHRHTVDASRRTTNGPSTRAERPVDGAPVAWLAERLGSTSTAGANDA